MLLVTTGLRKHLLQRDFTLLVAACILAQAGLYDLTRNRIVAEALGRSVDACMQQQHQAQSNNVKSRSKGRRHVLRISLFDYELRAGTGFYFGGKWLVHRQTLSRPWASS